MKRNAYVPPVPTALDIKVAKDAAGFVYRAIDVARTPKSKGIHSVITGLNGALRKHFEGCNPSAVLNLLADAGKIQIRPCKKGVMVYKAGEMPKSVDKSGDSLLAKMGGDTGAKFAL